MKGGGYFKRRYKDSLRVFGFEKMSMSSIDQIDKD
jgi:hypothetical protein